MLPAAHLLALAAIANCYMRSFGYIVLTLIHSYICVPY